MEEYCQVTDLLLQMQTAMPHVAGTQHWVVEYHQLPSEREAKNVKGHSASVQ